MQSTEMTVLKLTTLL